MESRQKMSWWVSLHDVTGEIYTDVSKFEEGGTFVVGGSTEADLNVTYNYGKLFDFKSLYGKTGEESIPLLEEAVKKYGTIQNEDYWEPTEGNVGFACSVLLAWAKQHPRGKWQVN
jgi:hypothetical protein